MMATSRRGGLERRATRALGGWAVGVFALLWLGLALTVIAAPGLPDEAWSWLRSLAPVPQVLAWVLFLPAAVGLWAWVSELPLVAGLAVWLGLVAWTATAVASLGRALRA